MSPTFFVWVWCRVYEFVNAFVCMYMLTCVYEVDMCLYDLCTPITPPPFFSPSSIANPDTFGAEIEKKCQSIFPLQNVFIRKVCMCMMRAVYCTLYAWVCVCV
ncbi:hypothetical protein EON63_06615 [archaeon]|nr:MAG: hypothetical protein EON63_06615 [archaeon]